MDQTQESGKDSLTFRAWKHENQLKGPKGLPRGRKNRFKLHCWRSQNYDQREEITGTHISGQREEVFLNKPSRTKIERSPWEVVSSRAPEPSKPMLEDPLTGKLQVKWKVTTTFLSRPETQFTVFFSLWQQPSQEIWAWMSESEDTEGK